MRLGAVLGFGILIAVTTGACAESTTPTLLNPDPQHGGACHDGDQLATSCLSSYVADAPPWCCTASEECGSGVGDCDLVVPFFDSTQIPNFAPRGHTARCEEPGKVWWCFGGRTCGAAAGHCSRRAAP
jgi:hypothetical protein